MRGAWSDEGKESRELSAKSWQETAKSPPLLRESPLVFLSPNHVADSSRRPQRKTRVQECEKTGRRLAFTALNSKGSHASQQTGNKNSSLFRILVSFLPNTASKNTPFRATFSLRAYSSSRPGTPPPRYPPTRSLPLSPVPLFHHENTFALPFERRIPCGLHPPLGRTRRSTRHTPPLHIRHSETVHHSHRQRIHSRQHFRRKRPPGSRAPHLPPPTHRPRLPTPAPIATRPHRQKRNTAFDSALRPFSTCRSDKTLAVSRLRCGFGHRCRKVGGEALSLATFPQTSFPTFVSGSKRGDATQTEGRPHACDRAIKELA